MAILLNILLNSCQHIYNFIVLLQESMPEHCSNVNTSIDTCFRMSSSKLHINDPIDKTLNSVRQLQFRLISHLSNVFVHLSTIHLRGFAFHRFFMIFRSNSRLQYLTVRGLL